MHFAKVSTSRTLDCATVTTFLLGLSQFHSSITHWHTSREARVTINWLCVGSGGCASQAHILFISDVSRLLYSATLLLTSHVGIYLTFWLSQGKIRCSSTCDSGKLMKLGRLRIVVCIILFSCPQWHLKQTSSACSTRRPELLTKESMNGLLRGLN